MLWVQAAPTRHEPCAPRPHAPADKLGGGMVLTFCAGVVFGQCLASVSNLLRLAGTPPRVRRP
jgi:hypothetical protein